MSVEGSAHPRVYIAGGVDITDAPPPGGYAITAGKLLSHAGGWGEITSGSFHLYGASDDGIYQPGDCVINCTNDHGVYSFHLGGANLLYADGSVRFATLRLRARAMIELISRSGGEVVNPE